MPLRLSEEDRSLQGAMETALVEGLQDRYEVFSGERVQQKAREIFNKESKTAKAECDETRCMEDIAIAFQAELIAVANVTKREDGYFLAISIQNIVDNKVVYSKSLPCENNSAYQIIDKLKELAGIQKRTLNSETDSVTSQIEMKPAKTSAKDTESDLWKEIQTSNTQDDYNVYLETYPKGKYALLAQTRIKKFKDIAQEQANQLEQKTWSTAEEENSEMSYESYLHSYPNGIFSGVAKVRQNKFKAERLAKAELIERQRAKEQLEREISYQAQDTSSNGMRGKALAAKCAACHGASFEKSALGKSGIVKGQSAYSIQASLMAYKAGTQNKTGMGALMKGQVARFSDSDIRDIAAYIETIR